MNKKKLIRLGVLATALLLLAVFFILGPSIVRIESTNGASILITESKDGVFKKIGTTKATHLFLKRPKIAYISAESDGKQSISSLQPSWLGYKSVNLSLVDTVPAKKIVDGAVVDAIFDGTKGQGIVYGQDTLVNFSTASADEPVNPELVGLPYVKKVVWTDFNNFVYQTDDGIGQFVNGKNIGSDAVGTSVGGSVNIGSGQTTSRGAPVVTDISKTNGKPLTLLSGTNIFTSNNMGTRLQAITSFEQNNRETSIFTTLDSIFKASSPAQDDSDSKKQRREKPRITLEEFSYAGKELRTIELEDSTSVVSIVKKGERTYVLTQADLHVIEKGKTRKQSLYFSVPADMTIYKDQVVVLAGDGLWKIAENSDAFQRLFTFNDYGIGLTSSMSVDPNNQLIFGTTPAVNKPSKTATFATSF